MENCTKCGGELTCNGEVKTPPIYAQLAGDERTDFWHRDRYVCVSCGDVFDIRRVDGEIVREGLRHNQIAIGYKRPEIERPKVDYENWLGWRIRYGFDIPDKDD